MIDLSSGDSATSYPVSYLNDIPSGGWGDEYKTTKLALRRIEPGTCGVTVDDPYYVGVFEVTQKQYELVTGKTPSHFSGNAKYPVEYVSYDMIRGSSKGAQYPSSTDVEADSFMGKLRSRTGLHVDLPTEAQWEYAGRAGATTSFFYGGNANGDYMWYSGNSGSHPHEVGTRKPNDWGLYDIHGNVFERCRDWYSTGARAIRGGGWYDGDGGCRFDYRVGLVSSDVNDNIGFRLVGEISETETTEAIVTNGSSDPVRIDLTVGTRTASDAEMITYSTAWVDGASADAVAVVSVDGQVLVETSGSGTIEWMPNLEGLYQLTHKVVAGGEQQGETLTAVFIVGGVPEGGPYTEVIDGVEWTFMVDGDMHAIIRAGSESAIPSGTIGTISIPSTLGRRAVTGVGDWAFSGCSGLTGVTIPTGVTYIGFEAFKSCAGLTSISIPSTVTLVAPSAFVGCSGLNSIEVDSANVNYTSQDGVLFDKSMNTIVKCPGGKWGEYTIPSSVTSIGGWAFWGCGGLTSLTIPLSVTSIGDNAFCGCDRLSELTIPSSVTSVGDNAFYGCSGLVSLTIPSSVTKLGSNVFRDCDNLTSISIPPSVTSIGDGAFHSCSSLTDLPIMSSVQSISDCAFIYCVGLENVSIQSGVTNIGSYAFSGCTRMTRMTIPSSVTGIGESAFFESDQLNAIDFEGAPPIGVADASIRDDAVIRYNVNYESEWLPVIAACGWTNATPYQPNPSVPGDSGATVVGDSESGFTIRPSDWNTNVVVSIPPGVTPDKVTVEVGTNVTSIKPNGASVKIRKGETDITSYLDVPTADSSGTIDLSQATVKQEIVKEALDPDKGAEIKLNAESPSLTTSETKIGLVYTLHEGVTLKSMSAGDIKEGDGQPWTPNISVKGGASGFYSIGVTK